MIRDTPSEPCVPLDARNGVQCIALRTTRDGLDAMTLSVMVRDIKNVLLLA
jgi:hypothetical protein